MMRRLAGLFSQNKRNIYTISKLPKGVVEADLYQIVSDQPEISGQVKELHTLKRIYDQYGLFSKIAIYKPNGERLDQPALLFRAYSFEEVLTKIGDKALREQGATTASIANPPKAG
ncbi:MAG: hypothetical protein SFW66_00510 [Gammaproteobacteria bacterium]|nr:hypothetical protein [Gammaproteobacteria bacterium]